MLYFGRVKLCVLAVADFYYRVGSPLADARSAHDDTRPWAVFAQRFQRLCQDEIRGGGVVHYFILSIINGQLSIMDICSGTLTHRYGLVQYLAMFSNIGHGH
jgi:hypothetical protein